MLTAPKGTRDVLPPESAIWRQVENAFAEHCRRFAFREIRIPTFEQTELFQRGVGDTTDIVQKEMYTFDDKGGRSMTLRPEGTAGVVRSYLEQGLASWPSPVKLFYEISAFRYEKMQKGRYREFHQLGAELFASASPLADVEMVSLLWQFFTDLCLKELCLKINSIGCPSCRKRYYEALRAYIRPSLASFCTSCQSRFEKNPMRIIDCKEERCQELIHDCPKQLDYLCDTCREHHQAFRRGLDELHIPYIEDVRIVRGLDYYTRSVFEFVSSHVGSQGSICGGGRYDGLVAEMGGPDTPAVGFALGLERLLMELESQGVLPSTEKGGDLYLACFPEQRLQAMALASELRRVGLQVELDLCERSFKAQMKAASRSGAKYLAVLGEQEVADKRLKIKRLSDGEEREQTFTELAAFLQTED